MSATRFFSAEKKELKLKEFVRSFGNPNEPIFRKTEVPRSQLALFFLSKALEWKFGEVEATQCRLVRS